MISRIILNNLTIQILEQEIDLSEAHKQFAISKIPSIRADLLKEYLDKLKLNPLLDPNYLLSLAKKKYEENRFRDVALMIKFFKLYDHFDIK